jgi:hypothetical protein
LKQTYDDRTIDTATLVGWYGVFVQFEEFPEALFIRQESAGLWQLWTISTLPDSDMDELLRRHTARDPSWRKLASSFGLVLAGTGVSSASEAAHTLVKKLLWARLGYCWPEGPFQGGLLASEQLWAIVSDFQRDVASGHANAMAAENRRPTPIVVAARELGLSPQPAGHDPMAWTATCPTGRNHRLMISAEANEFGCGYCRVKGGPDGLRRFVARAA